MGTSGLPTTAFPQVSLLLQDLQELLIASRIKFKLEVNIQCSLYLGPSFPLASCVSSPQGGPAQETSQPRPLARCWQGLSVSCLCTCCWECPFPSISTEPRARAASSMELSLIPWLAGTVSSPGEGLSQELSSGPLCSSASGMPVCRSVSLPEAGPCPSLPQHRTCMKVCVCAADSPTSSRLPCMPGHVMLGLLRAGRGLCLLLAAGSPPQ